MLSRSISRASAALLGAGGVLLLFASDVVLPHVIPGFPMESAWLGQLVAAGWLAVAALNWMSQATLLGGIYGRPQVLANFALYFITATSVIRPALGPTAPGALWIVAAPSAAMAGLYGWLLFRGPFERDFPRQAGRDAQGAAG